MVKVWCVFDDVGGLNYKELQFIRSTREAAEFEAYSSRGMNPNYTYIEEWEVD